MSFLDDKKNQPIIIGVTVAILLAVGVFLYLQMRPQQPQVDDSAMSQPAVDPTAAATPTDPSQAQPAAAPVDPAAQMAMGTGTPGGSPTGGAAPAAAMGATSRPIEKFRVDPFAELYRPKPKGGRKVVVRENIPYPTWLIVPKKLGAKQGDIVVENEVIDTTPRRMAGVMFGSTVSAILETGSETLVVKPGDIIENSAMRVEKIEPNRIVLKSLMGKTRYVDVRMAASLGNAPASMPAPSPAMAPPSVNPYAPIRPGAPGGRPAGGGRGS